MGVKVRGWIDFVIDLPLALLGWRFKSSLDPLVTWTFDCFTIGFVGIKMQGLTWTFCSVQVPIEVSPDGYFGRFTTPEEEDGVGARSRSDGSDEERDGSQDKDKMLDSSEEIERRGGGARQRDFRRREELERDPEKIADDVVIDDDEEFRASRDADSDWRCRLRSKKLGEGTKVKKDPKKTAYDVWGTLMKASELAQNPTAADIKVVIWLLRS